MGITKLGYNIQQLLSTERDLEWQKIIPTIFQNSFVSEYFSIHRCLFVNNVYFASYVHANTFVCHISTMFGAQNQQKYLRTIKAYSMIN